MKVKQKKELEFIPVTLEVTFETKEEIEHLYNRLKDGTLKCIELSHALGELLSSILNK